MLYQAALYLLISILCLWSGLLFFSIFRWIAPVNSGTLYRRPLAGYFLSGLILLTAIGQWLVLWSPLNPFTFLIYIIPFLLILSLFLRRHVSVILQQLRTSLPNHPFFFFCFVVFLLLFLVLFVGFFFLVV